MPEKQDDDPFLTEDQQRQLLGKKRHLWNLAHNKAKTILGLETTLARKKEELEEVTNSIGDIDLQIEKHEWAKVTRKQADGATPTAAPTAPTTPTVAGFKPHDLQHPLPSQNGKNTKT